MALEKLIPFVPPKKVACLPSFLAAMCEVNLKKALSYMTSATIKNAPKIQIVDQKET